jgi:hypothetical protein
MERFAAAPAAVEQQEGPPRCPYCGKRHARNSLDDACPAEWAASDAAQRRRVQATHPLVDSTAQPAPQPSTGPALWDLVTQDMQGRDHFGKHKYGIRLQPHNGRDFLVDAYQEALDLAVYLRGLMYERDGK